MTHENSKQTVDTESTTAWANGIVDGLTTYGERAGDALVYSSTYLSCVAMVKVAIVMLLLSIPPSPVPVIAFLVTFAVYVYDRLVDVETDAISNHDQAAYVRTRRDVLYVLASVAYSVAVALSLFGGPMAVALTLLPGMFGLLYTSDWLPERFDPRRLKDVFLVNSGVVALAWAVSVTFLPLAYSGAAFTPLAGVVFCYFFLRTFVATELPNVRDVDADRTANVATLPTEFGVRRTRQILYAVDLLTVGLVGAAAWFGIVSSVAAAALSCGVLVSLALCSRLGRTADIDSLVVGLKTEYVVAFAALLLAGWL